MNPPRSVWVVRSLRDGNPYSVHRTKELAIGHLMHGCEVVRYVLPPKRKARKARRGGNPGVTMANELLMRDPRFREMLGAKARKGERSKR